MSFKDFVQGSNRGRLNTDVQGYNRGRLNTDVQGYNMGRLNTDVQGYNRGRLNTIGPNCENKGPPFKEYYLDLLLLKSSFTSS